MSTLKEQIEGLCAEAVSFSARGGPHTAVFTLARAIRLLAQRIPEPETVEGEGWEPIETAPNDGTTFWAFQPNAFIGGKDWQYECTLTGDILYHGFGDAWPKPAPTHWRPHPKPPETTPAEQDASAGDGLLPCPFCGNDGSGPIEHALHVSHTENHDHIYYDCYNVQCDKCTATMGYSRSEEDAIEAWNRRPQVTAPAIGDSLANMP